MAPSDWRQRPIRMCRFDYLGEMLPDDPAWLAEHARLVRQELHPNLEWVIAPPASSISSTVFEDGGNGKGYMIVMLTVLTYQPIGNLNAGS